MKTYVLTQERIDEIFEKAVTQHDAFLALYREAYSDWDEIDHIDGWPQVSNDTNEYILQKFITLDREVHPDVIAGGIWFNQGFSSSPEVRDWLVRQAPYTKK